MPARIPSVPRRVRPLSELASIDFLLPFARVGKRGMAHLTVKATADDFGEGEAAAGPSKLPPSRLKTRFPGLQPVPAAHRSREPLNPNSRPRIPRPPLKPLYRSIPPSGGPFRSPASTRPAAHTFKPRPKPLYDPNGHTGVNRLEKTTHHPRPRPQRPHRPERVVFNSVYSVYNPSPDQPRKSPKLKPPSQALTGQDPQPTPLDSTLLSTDTLNQPPWRGFRSFTHYTLSLPNPPSASDILEHLRLKPSLITKPALKCLAHYARRTGDQESELKSMQALLTLDPREHGLLSMTRPKIDKRANRMLFQLFPPRKTARTDDVQSVLCDLHHRLLTASVETPPPTYQEALESVRNAARLEGKSKRSLDVDIRSVINLFVVYCESVPGNPGVIQVLKDLVFLCSTTRPTSHNLYCAVNQLLFPRSLQPYHPPWPKLAPKELKKKHRPKLKRSVDPEVLTQLQSLLELFRSRWGTFPTAATNKHILMFASGTHNIDLAADAFKAFYKSFDYRGHSPASDGEHARFRRRGRAWHNFRNQARALKHKGWVEVLENPKPGERKYRFVGLAPEKPELSEGDEEAAAKDKGEEAK